MSIPFSSAKSSGAERLAEYLAAVRDIPFAWGSHDCVTFTKGAVEAQTGREVDIPSYRGLRDALILGGRLDIVEELDRRFARCPHVPPPGSIVRSVSPVAEGLGWRLGVVVSDKAAFVSPNGLAFARLRPDTDLYWIVT